MPVPLRLLLVEGSADDALLVVQALERGGFDVSATRVETADAMSAELACAEWDVVIADYNLPRFDGTAALRLVQAIGKDIPFILVSGTVSDDAAIEIINAGAHDFIRTDQLARLPAAVQQVMDAARASHPQPPPSAPPTPPLKPRLRWRTSVVGKLTLAAVAMFVVLLAVLAYVRWMQLQSAESDAIRDGEHLAQAIALAIVREGKLTQTLPLFADPVELQAFVADLGRIATHESHEGYSIVVVDRNKKVVANTVVANIGTTFDHDAVNEVSKTMADGKPRAFVEISPEYPAGIKQLVVPLKLEQSETVGAVILEYTPLYQEHLTSRIEQTTGVAIVLIGAIALLIVAMSYVSSRVIIRPLNELRQAAVRLGLGQLDTPVPIGRADEIGELADAFEEMRVNLRAALDAQCDEVQRRARVEASLLASNQTLRTLVDTAPVAITHVTTDAIVRLWNPGAERLFGWRASEVVNRPLPIIPPDKRDEFDALFERMRHGEVIIQHETTRLRKDGTCADVALSLSPLRDPGGAVTGSIAIIHDMTDRKRAEEARQQADAEIAASVRALEGRTAELDTLREMTELVQSSSGPGEAQPVLQRYLTRLFPNDTGTLYLLPPSRDYLEAVAVWGAEAARMALTIVPDDCWALRRGRTHHARTSRNDAFCRHMPAADMCESLCAPLTAQGEVLGILHVCRREAAQTPAVEQAFLSLAEMVANSIALSIANLRLRETLRQQSIRDPLTGLFNRRYLEEMLTREVLRARRLGAPLGAIMLDLDHFKRFNDTHGHDAGDAVLSALGRFLQDRVRGDDIACRYGGEEFTLILPGASLDIVRERAEQLRVNAQSLAVRFADRQLEAITLSLGVAVVPQHGETASAVLKAADAALYRAKHNGRNRVEVAA
ncbi:MAG: diguanylate cyclase [Chloroflexi bacterium]|nr:diguanylate cyclase [Chloroflexota bacterium]